MNANMLGNVLPLPLSREQRIVNGGRQIRVDEGDELDVMAMSLFLRHPSVVKETTHIVIYARTATNKIYRFDVSKGTVIDTGALGRGITDTHGLVDCSVLSLHQRITATCKDGRIGSTQVAELVVCEESDTTTRLPDDDVINPEDEPFEIVAEFSAAYMGALARQATAEANGQQ